MSKIKIEKALKIGRAISLGDYLAKDSKNTRKEVYERARYISVAMELKKLRKSMSFSQADLAKKIDSKRELITRIESGRQNVTLETLFRIAEATGKNFQFSFK